MMFNIDDYTGNFIMHCKNSEEADIFFEYLHSVGRTWCTGESYLGTHPHNADVPYYMFNTGHRTGIDSGYTVLEFSDFDWGESWDDGVEWDANEVLCL